MIYIDNITPTIGNIMKYLEVNIINIDINQALNEVRDFMKVNGVAEKERQKLMRNLRVNFI